MFLKIMSLRSKTSNEPNGQYLEHFKPVPNVAELSEPAVPVEYPADTAAA